MKRYLWLALLAALATGVAGVHAQPVAVEWRKLAPAATAPARDQAALAANPAGGVVLFGGSIETPTGLLALGDTWTFDGERWQQEDRPFGPPPRAQAAMAYDAARGVALLFGGNTFTQRLGDTWTWDGTDWNLPRPAVAPSARSQAAIAYGAARGVVLLFGGTGGAGGLSDTWSWDGADWTLLHPQASPPALIGAAMAYDANTDRIVLYGGCRAGGQNCLPSDDTWAWDGSTWTRQTPAARPPLTGGSLAALRGAGVILFGGAAEGQSMRSQTWRWDGASWSELSLPSQPPAGFATPMAATATGDAIVLFDGAGGTWTFPGAAP